MFDSLDVGGRISKKSQLQPRKKGETDLDYLGRVTHLQLQSQFIDKIASIPECQSVAVVYLQNNLLRTVQNLDNFPNLTHLYLQHNFISKIENFDRLTSLRKLYLASNEISVVEGLENLVNLTELHLEGQRLPPGETLYFDPLTLAQLRKTLKVLNVSNNNMPSMRCLSGLLCLSKLLIENNAIKDLDDVMETLKELPALEVLNSEGNPVASNRKYLDAVVIASQSIKTLNDKPIDDKTRIFIRNLAQNREFHRNSSALSTRVLVSSESFPMAKGKIRPLEEKNSVASARLGSKLFPVLKGVADSRRRTGQSPCPVFKSSLNVSGLSGSASFHL